LFECLLVSLVLVLAGGTNWQLPAAAAVAVAVR
jgi:hypothetical protein